MDKIDEKDTLTQIDLGIDTPDDIAEKDEKTLKSKVKDAFSNIFTQETETDDDISTTKKRGRPKKNTKEKKGLESYCDMFSGGILLLMSMFLPQQFTSAYNVAGDTFTLAPNQLDVNAVIRPLLRIVDRHTSIIDLSDDQKDLSLSMLAIFSYLIMLQSHLHVLKTLEKIEEKNKNVDFEANSFNRNISSNGPTI